jgi:hypothetical protein
MDDYKKVNIVMRLLALLMFGLSLSACVTPTNVVKPLSEENSGTINVQSVVVTYSDFSKSTIIAADEELHAQGIEEGKAGSEDYLPLKEVVTEIVEEQLELRDTDQDQLAVVEIEIDNFKLAHRGLIFLTGDTDQLVGTVRVYDAKSKEILTELYVDVLNGHSGLLGIAIRGGDVREQLSAKFANIIGDELGFEETQ